MSAPHPLEKEIRDAFHTRKRLFIGLITATSVLVCLILALLWVIPFVGLRALHPWAPWILGAVVALTAAFIVWTALGLVLTILRGRSVLFTGRIRGLTIRLFLPIMTVVGKLIGVPKEKVRASFIKVNNELVLSEDHACDPDEILLLMPHCLQNSRCRFRLTYSVANCERCGLCPMAGLIDFSERYGVHLALATGGTIARRIVVQTRPKLIIAVACERDLAAGIQDTHPIPVFGILNQRPHGPCLDTAVPLEQVEWAIRRFLRPGSFRP